MAQEQPNGKRHHESPAQPFISRITPVFRLLFAYRVICFITMHVILLVVDWRTSRAKCSSGHCALALRRRYTLT